nr:efflux RND transporter periplasmic adaptor subunit [uncultured Caproiciproducens sp.]
MKYKQYLAGFTATALLLAFCIGCRNGNSTSKQTAAGVSSSVETNSVVAWGEVKYNDEYQVNIDFPSTVQNVLVKEGDIVKRGDSLITLSTDDYQKNIKKLQAQVSASQAALNNVNQAAIEADIAVLKKQISSKTEELNNGDKPELQLLHNSLTRAEKEIKDAQSDLNKYKTLFNDGVISQADLDKYSDVLNLKQKAKADIQDNITKTKHTLQEELDSLNTSLKYKEVQLNQQKDGTTTAQIDLDIMNSKTQKPYLSGNTIISNLDNGIVKEISVVEGSSVGTQYAAQKVIDLIDGNSIYVSAEVPEEFIQQISFDSEVIIVPTANKDLKISGHIVQISNEAVEKDGDRIVKVQVKPDDKGNVLKPGFTADVQFSRTAGKSGKNS